MNQETEAQIELEKLFAKNQLLSRLRREFRQPEVVELCEQHKLPVDFAIDLLAQMVLHKRAGIGILVGLLHRHFGTGQGERQDLQDCADMIGKAIESRIVNWDPIAWQVTVAIETSDEVYAELELYQYPLPMVIEPQKVRCNRDTGYLTMRGSLILKGGNHHEDDICLDHINRVNQVALTINVDTARMVRNQWKNLDKQKEDETAKDFQDRVSAFQKYDRNAKEVMEMVFVTGDRFWLTHKYDKRGRTYAQGYHVNPQGNAWNKAVVEFAKKEIVR